MVCYGVDVANGERMSTSGPEPISATGHPKRHRRYFKTSMSGNFHVLSNKAFSGP